MAQLVMVYSVYRDEKEARKIAKVLLKNNLIACANIFPIKSIYRWKGKIIDSKEVAMIAKTISKNKKSVEKLIIENHSYEIPCISFFNTASSKEYGDWVNSEVR